MKSVLVHNGPNKLTIHPTTNMCAPNTICCRTLHMVGPCTSQIVVPNLQNVARPADFDTSSCLGHPSLSLHPPKHITDTTPTSRGAGCLNRFHSIGGVNDTARGRNLVGRYIYICKFFQLNIHCTCVSKALFSQLYGLRHAFRPYNYMLLRRPQDTGFLQ